MRAWSPARFTVPLPEGHRFPIAKYQRIRDGVIERGLLEPSEVEEPDRVERWALGLVHVPSYVESIMEGTLGPLAVRRLGFPWSEQLRERSLRTVQGTVEAAYDALGGGAGISLAGGTHHAFAAHGEGFCVFNDVAVAVRVLQREGRVRRVAIVDLDVHQGNGTASILGGDPDVFTFSMHGSKNFPFRRERSTLDVELEDHTGDAAYCSLLAAHLEDVLDDVRPDLVFYLAGADPYVEDRFGRLALSLDGLRARDRLVFEGCGRRGLPVVMTLAGGYARALEDVVSIHATTVGELRRVYG
jgi:acetoin utilization deacetylase AcuC-like enzyme